MKSLLKIIALAFIGFYNAKQDPEKSTVIILAGYSYVGKTVVADKLMEMSKLGLVWVSWNLFFEKMIKCSPELPQYDKYWKLISSEDGSVKRVNGPNEPDLSALRFPLAGMLAKNGHNVLIDDNLEDPTDLVKSYMVFLDPRISNIYVFGLQCSEETKKKRAKLRNDNEEIQNRNDFPSEMVFDLIIQTDDLTPEEVAQKIIDHVNSNEPQAAQKYGEQKIECKVNEMRRVI